MDKRGGTLLALVIALSLLLNPKVSRQASGNAGQNVAGSLGQRQPRNTPQSRGQQASQYVFNIQAYDPRGFLSRVISEYYGNSNVIPPPNQSPAWGIEPGQKTHIRFLIATAPDPVRSHLSLFFDRTMDALQQAVQDANYSFVRAVMPWDSAQHAELTDFEGRLEQDNYQREKEKLPGLMIFRKIDEASCEEQQIGCDHGANAPAPPQTISDQTLLVFVVGETPTGGIHKVEFKNALAIMKTIRSAIGDQGKVPLDIFGPSFSGSLPSLNDLLTSGEVQHDYSTITVRSGTVTGFTPVQRFLANTPAHVDFATFQESDTYASCRFLAYAQQQNYRLDEIVMLSEDETAYGTFNSDPESKECGSILDASSASPEEKDEVAHIYFPREIAQLRAAYQRDLQTGQIADPTGKRPAQPTLPLNLSDTGADEEGVPTYAHAQYPLSQESVMLGIVTALRYHHARFVILKASDPLDMLFLARYLRQSYPRGRIVTAGGDLLFRREIEDDLLHGIMAITPYSLLPGADSSVARPQSYKDRSDIERVFPDSGSAGAYNAVRSLLARNPGSNNPIANTGGSWPADLNPAFYTEYGWPALGGRPPDGRPWLAPALWLTVLGRDAYWPMALLDTFPKSPDSSQKDPGPPSRLHAIQGQPAPHAIEHPEDFSRTAPLEWVTFCALICVYVLVFLFLCWCGTLFSTSESGVNFAPAPDKSRSCVILFAGLMAEVLLLLLLWPWQRWLTRLKPWGWGAGIFLILVGFLVGAACDLKRRSKKRAFYLFLVFSTAMIVFAFWTDGWGPDSYDNFMVFRYMHVTSGVSPLPALTCLVLAGIWWAWYTLKGLTFIDNRRPQLPSKDQLKQLGYFPMTDEGSDTLLHVMRPASLDFRILLPVLLITVIFFLLADWSHFRWAHPVQTLEGSRFDRLFAIASWAVVFVLLTTLARLNVTWLECRRLLLALDRSPLRRGLSQLPGFSWKPIWSLGGGSFQDCFRFMSRELEVLRHVKNMQTLAPRDLNGEETAIATEMAKFAPMLQTVSEQPKTSLARWHRFKKLRQAKFNGELIKLISGLQQKLAHACGVVLESLIGLWDAERVPNSFDIPAAEADTKNTENKGPDLPSATQLRERFVSLGYANFLVMVLLRMHTLIVTVAGMYVFLLLAFSVYPIEPKAVIQPLLIILFFAILAVVGTIYAQMHRDATLSRLTKTNIGELGMDFWIRIGSFVILPLVGLLASQFPDISNFLFSWLTPATQALNH